MTTQAVVKGRKQCAQCKQWLHAREFRPMTHLRSGLDSWCRPCHRAANREWRAVNAVALNIRRRAAYASRAAALNR